MANFLELQDKIGYEFKQEKLLRQALTHSSFANEKHLRKHSDNERLEFWEMRCWKSFPVTFV